MARKKNLLVIDWANIMFRSLFMNQLYSASTTYDMIEDMQSFTYKFAIDMCSIINLFKPDNVIIAADSQHVWRKDILAQDEIVYKGGRVKNPNINWDNIYKCADDLLNIFEEHNIHVAKFEHCEADDMCALCKELIFEKFVEYNMIIVSADADLRQLIQFDTMTKQYCIVYNTTGNTRTKQRNMYVSQAFYDWYTEEVKQDIFFSNIDYDRQYIKDILNNNQLINIEIEDPDSIVLNKIFCGDMGDNVPSIYSWYNNGKQNRVTPAKAKKIMEGIGIYSVKDLIDNEFQLKPILEKVCKREINDIDIHERVERQRKLVELNSNLFPAEIREYKNTIECMIDDLPPEGFHTIKAQTLLAGTDYAKFDKKKAIEADIFKDMSKYVNQKSIPIF